MSSSFEQHIPSLHEPLLHEFVAALCCLSRLASSREEDAAFFVLHRHEVSRNLDVDDVGSVGVTSEVVHEEVVRVVNEEMQSVQHLLVVAH